MQRANATFNTTAAVLNQLPAPFCQALATWQAPNQWNDVLQRADTWITEIGHVQNRLPLIHQLVGWGAGGAAGDTVYRVVSHGEALGVQAANGVFKQAPGGQANFEREKWFYHGGGAPGVGHNFLLTITLKAGSIAALTAAPYVCQRDAQDWDDHIVFTKPNEPNCFGMHEDALGAFNQLVRRVRCAPTNPQNPQQLNYDLNHLNNVPAYPNPVFNVNP
jgi:hypothetical protein